jgi:tetratricopeptide (TPR) repeat protein
MVKAWQERVIIPTYQTGEPDKNPLFLEKRVYQGSSGTVYPFAVIDKIFDDKEDKEYTAVFLENEYLKIMILPELGGRIQMALDKTNNYHFVYYNQVIKPALVGLTGPWISGGIEFNWPQHHRPSTFEPVDFCIEENEDGSKTVWINEIEQMFHTKGMAGFTLYPDKAYLEIKGKLYNRTALPQTFLWWANPAVAVDEHYQSVFPPDVNAVYDHGKRDVSSFPIATGTYYKVDYSPGTDISRYTNIPVPTSYMAVNSAFDFVGGYHHKKKAGILHVSNHHISPGKKQWTWGCGEFGRAWDKQLTDEDGPYFELMTGMFTDNQPDFGWIKPNEERNFCQYFMPYKNIGYVKNATIDAAVNLEVNWTTVFINAYTTSTQLNAKIRLWLKDQLLLEEVKDLSPTETFESSYFMQETFDITDLKVEVLDNSGQLLVAYSPVPKKEEAIPDPAKPIGCPASIATNEELFLAAKHLEQYRHATYSPVDYYEEALRRDPSDIRNNQGLGAFYLAKGQYEKAASYFNKGIERLIKHNPNPYDIELYYQLGLTLFYQRKFDEAYNAFYKTYWSKEWQDNGALFLSRIDCKKKDYKNALMHAGNSINKNYHGFHARHIKTAILRLTQQYNEAFALIEESLRIDTFQFGILNEKYLLLKSLNRNGEAEACLNELNIKMRFAATNYIELAIDYEKAGLYEEAIEILERVKALSGSSLVYYYQAFYYSLIQQKEKANQLIEEAKQLPVGHCFSNRLEDIEVLEFVAKQDNTDYKAWYYLGNILYDKKQYAAAINAWEQAVALNDSFATAHRNLGIAYYNRNQDAKAAVASYEKAFNADVTDARILFELDHLYKRIGRSPEQRLKFLNDHCELVQRRDDLFIEFVTLHNLLGQHDVSAQLLSQRNFHPWEGGEGKVSTQHIITQVELAKKEIAEENYESAIRFLHAAEVYPDNLGEGKLFGAKENDIHFWLGCAYDALENAVAASIHFNLATEGDSNPAPAIFYNDQSPDKILYQALACIKLGQQEKAALMLNKLIAYADEHMNDEIKTDYFAVSLPELMIFDDDLNMRNRIHCLYMKGLGHLGLNNLQLAKNCFEQVLALDICHQGAAIHLHIANSTAIVFAANSVAAVTTNN